MIAAPPSLAGAVKLTVACVLPAVAVPMVGAPGTVAIATVCVVPLVKPPLTALPARSWMPVPLLLRSSRSVPLPVMVLTVTV